MDWPRRSATGDVSLEEFVSRLASSPAVEAVVLIGSTAQQPVERWSDYDFLVVLAEAGPAAVAVTHVDGRLADIIFTSAGELEELAAGSTVIERGAFLCNWLISGTVGFDRGGRVTAIRERLTSAPPVYSATKHDVSDRWRRANYNLAQNERYAAGPEPYQRALELRMLYSLSDLMTDYFVARGLVWKGEKAAIAAWEASDPGYAALFFACARARDSRDRVATYRELVERTWSPLGGVWAPGWMSARPTEGASTEEAERFVDRLLAGS